MEKEKHGFYIQDLLNRILKGAKLPSVDLGRVNEELLKVILLRS